MGEIKIKRLSYKRRIYLDRRSRKILGAIDGPDRSLLKRRLRRNKPIDNSRWRAPKIFGIVDQSNRTSFIEALELLRRQLGIRKQAVCLDFTNTEKMYAEGTLIFVAELRRLVRHTQGEVEITCELSRNNKVCQVLKQVGVLDLLGVKAVVTPVDNDVVNWRAAHGERADGERYEDVLGHYDGEITPLLQDQLYTGITEAMTNVINHAYDMPRNDGLKVKDNKDWWMFSQQHDGHLVIAFCDLGAGIPRTLPLKRPKVWRLIARFGRTSDAETIGYAVKDSISRTGQGHRGKGLGQIVRVIDEVVGGKVTIFSNRGAYLRQDGRGKQFSYRDTILGTLIFWRIPLPSKEDT